jgi:hypothetical protein
MSPEQVRELGGAILECIERAFNAATAHTNALEARVAELEARQLKYLGVWRDAPHLPGNLVTHAGALWHCWKATTTRPGTSDDWQLTGKTR